MSRIKWRLMGVFGVLLIMGIDMMFDSIRDSSAMSKGITDFNEMTESDFEVGRFVQGDVVELLGQFAYEYEESRYSSSEKVTKRYYLMPLYATYDYDNPKYVAVCISNTQMAKAADKIVEETWDYYDYGTEPDKWTELYITGKVSKIDKDIEDLLYEWLLEGEEGSTRAEMESYVCPYVITYYQLSAASGMTGIGAVMFIIGTLGLAVVIVIHLKSKKQGETVYVNETPNSGQTSLYPENQYKSTGINGEDTEQLMRQMEKIKQPADNSEEFFSNMGRKSEQKKEQTAAEPVKKEETPVIQNFGGMDEIDTSALGIGIDDEN